MFQRAGRLHSSPRSRCEVLIRLVLAAVGCFPVDADVAFVQTPRTERELRIYAGLHAVAARMELPPRSQVR